MTRLSRFQRLAVLTASTTVITGGALLPSTAFAAPAPQSTSVVSVTDADGADSSADWKVTTDTASGVKVKLPGQPGIKEFTEEKDGTDSRIYMVPTDYGIVGLTVFDSPSGTEELPWDMKGTLHDFLVGANEDVHSPDDKIRSTNVREDTTADGRHALEADLDSEKGNAGQIRLVDLGDHLVMTITLGSKDAKDTMKADHDRLVDSIQLPADKRGQAT